MTLNDSSQTPSYGWTEVWTAAVTQPNLPTYSAIIADPRATMRRALIWVYAVSLIEVLVLANSVFSSEAFQADLQQAMLATGVTEVSASTLYANLLCAAPFGTALALGLFVLFGASIQWVATNLAQAKGVPKRGNLRQLIYALGASYAPLTLVRLFFTVIIPPLALVALALQVYQVWLGVVAVRAVYGLDSWRAAIAVIVPSVGAVVLLSLVIASSLGI